VSTRQLRSTLKSEIAGEGSPILPKPQVMLPSLPPAASLRDRE
jgi:hypothetical protein